MALLLLPAAANPTPTYLVLLADSTGTTYTPLGTLAQLRPVITPLGAGGLLLLPVPDTLATTCPPGSLQVRTSLQPGYLAMHSNQAGLVRLYNAQGHLVAVVGLLAGANQVALALGPGVYFWTFGGAVGRLVLP